MCTSDFANSACFHPLCKLSYGHRGEHDLVPLFKDGNIKKDECD